MNAVFRFRQELQQLHPRLSQTIDDLVNAFNAPLETGTTTLTDRSGAGLVFVGAMNWAVIGQTGGRRVIHVSVSIRFPTTANTNFARVGDLPFPAVFDGGLAIGTQLGGAGVVHARIQAGLSVIYFVDPVTAVVETNAQLTGAAILASGTYMTST